MSSLLSPLMVVGDDASFCYLMQRYAKKAACSIVLAHFAEDALTIALHAAPVVVIVELDAPGDKGLSIMGTLKAHPATCNIPVILCSWTEETEHNALWNSDDESAAIYLRKPILYDDFQAALTEVGVNLNMGESHTS